jgi:hypothetical protein
VVVVKAQWTSRLSQAPETWERDFVEVFSDRTYHLPILRQDLWRRILVVEDYPSWWPWLRHFDACSLAVGEVWRGTLRPPLPYAISCDVRFETVVEPELIAASLSGDLAGRARIYLHDEIGGTEAHVVSQLRASNRLIRIVARTLPRLARRGHDWVLDTAAHQFGAVPLGRSSEPAIPPPVRSGGPDRASVGARSDP